MKLKSMYHIRVLGGGRQKGFISTVVYEKRPSAAKVGDLLPLRGKKSPPILSLYRAWAQGPGPGHKTRTLSTRVFINLR